MCVSPVVPRLLRPRSYPLTHSPSLSFSGQQILNNTAFAINVAQGSDTYEYRACIVGCGLCGHQLETASLGNEYCATTCNDNVWSAATVPAGEPNAGAPSPILKGVIEANKACQFGVFSF